MGNLELKSPTIFQNIFVELYEKTPKDIKKKIVIPEIFGSVFKTWDFVSLNIIISDKELQDCKEKFVDFYKDKANATNYNAPEDMFKHLQKFSHILSTDQKDKLKQNFSHYLEYYARKDDDFNLANSFLNWLSDSEELRMSLKKGINTKKLGREFLNKERYDFIEKFLKWQFDVQEGTDLIKLKEKLQLNSDCIRWQFFEIWAKMSSLSDLEAVKNRCLKLLTWCLSSDNISDFVKEKLIGDDILILLCQFVSDKDHDFFEKRMNELFRFCDTPLDQQVNVKQRVKKHVDEWFEIGRLCKFLGDLPRLWDPREEGYRYFKFSDFNTLDAIINWTFMDGNKKLAITRFINDSKGAEFIVEAFDCYDRSYRQDFTFDIFEKWLIPYGDIAKIKNKVENIVLKNHESVDKYQISGIVKLLDILQKKSTLLPDDIVSVKNIIGGEIYYDECKNGW